MDITVAIVNYQTPDFLEVAVRSFKEIYPEVSLLIADNGSEDHSKEVIDKLIKELPLTEAIFFEKNIYHGPAMDLIVREHIDSSYVFFLDSDTETHSKGFLEEMTNIAEEEKVYSVGEVISVNDRGFKDRNGFDVLITPYFLLKKEYYKSLPPFIHHGQPTIRNFKKAQQEGLRLINFPISEYIHHHWRGTASRFGYGLGLKGKLDYFLNKLGL